MTSIRLFVFTDFAFEDTLAMLRSWKMSFKLVKIGKFVEDLPMN